MTNFNIQIISDTVCPWCYVGFRRLTRAITTHKATHPADTFTLTWHAFYLNPNSPSFPGLDKTEYYKSKFGADRASAIFDRLGAVGQSEGIKFSFGGRTGNTRDSHRLMWYAGQKEKIDTEKKDDNVIGGLQTRVAEKLFRAYFEEEKNVTDREVLEGGKEVDLEAEKARRQLVTGVPYYMIQGQYAVEGADEPETFLEVFEQVKRSS
ncbi:Cytochrome P450 family protein [Aspergillus niger]|uniref:Cytochrome P450 family protein n=1 Tax=Aspergillus niger TaxID=5061 RepID=A0A505I5S6_ASPNG|nr:Cytochrome P450 family protein [Aspergillus niger]